MGNIGQRLIYNVSIAVPLVIVLAIVYYVQQKNIVISIILILFGVLLVASLFLSFNYAVKNLETISFRATDIKPHDNWILVYIISYAFPLSSIVFENVDVKLTVVLATALIVYGTFVNEVKPHPLLFMCRYHFYIVSAENGVSDYVLISKKKALRNTKHIKKVKRLFEYLLIEA